jgi:hypothetical protein
MPPAKLPTTPHPALRATFPSQALMMHHISWNAPAVPILPLRNEGGGAAKRRRGSRPRAETRARFRSRTQSGLGRGLGVGRGLELGASISGSRRSRVSSAVSPGRNIGDPTTDSLTRESSSVERSSRHDYPFQGECSGSGALACERLVVRRRVCRSRTFSTERPSRGGAKVPVRPAGAVRPSSPSSRPHSRPPPSLRDTSPFCEG